MFPYSLSTMSLSNSNPKKTLQVTASHHTFLNMEITELSSCDLSCLTNSTVNSEDSVVLFSCVCPLLTFFVLIDSILKRQ